VAAPRLRAAALVALLALLTVGAAQSDGDPYRSQQWGLDRVRAPEVWTRTLGRDIVVAIVDTGVDLTHPDLTDRLLRDASGAVIGRDFVDDDDDPQDENGHGTMVAGIVAASVDNGEGIAGAAPAVRIMPVRVLDADGGGRSGDLDDGIRWAVDNGAHVVNLSLESVIAAGVGLPGSAPTAAVDYAWQRGVVVVAAAGNSDTPYTDYPPTSPAVLVGATDRDDEKAGFSDAGRTDALMAPGVEIVSTWCRPIGEGACDPELRYGVADGTSFAAPFVSAGVALLRELGYDHREAVDRLRATARDLGAEGPDLRTGVGLVDIAAAVGAETVSPPSPSPAASPEPSEVASAGESPSPAAEPEPTAEPTPEASPTAEASPEPTASDTPGVEPDVEDPRTPTAPSPLAAAPAGGGDDRLALLLIAVGLLLVTAVAVGVALREDH
jgi:subtilisin family serine protease